MARRQKLTFITLLGIATIAIMLLAAGLSQLSFHPGKPFDLLGILLSRLRSGQYVSPPPPSADNSFGLLRPIFWAMILISVGYAIVSPRYRRQLIRTVIIVLLLTILLSSISERLAREEAQSDARDEGSSATPGEVSLPDPPAFIKNPPVWFLIIVNVLLMLLILGVLWILWRLFGKRPDTQTLLVEEAAMALTELEAGGDIKNVVMRCYAGMCEILRQSRNVSRAKAMTPREFERHLAKSGMRDEHIQRLTRLFEGVRYGARPVGGRVEREATDCLRAIVQTYGETS